MKKDIKFVGLGGQGVLLASTILAKSVSVYDRYFAVMTDKYTSDMRGGEVSSDVIISSERVTYPLIEKPDFLVAFSQEGYRKYFKFLKPNGIFIYDSDLVTPSENGDEVQKFSASFNAIAVNKFQNRAVMNMIMLGFLSRKLSLASPESIKKTMHEEIDKKYIELNYKAFEKGVLLGG